MANWSLICFTLLIQGAVGLAFTGTLGVWLSGTAQATMALHTTASALGLSVLGLATALAHLASPRRAPHALRNPGTSWLSREVMLVTAFALCLALTMAADVLGFAALRTIMEVAALCLGGAALWAMTGVYLLATVPAWNTPATILEFSGSALLLGGALSIVWVSAAAAHPWGATETVAAMGMCLGWILKLAAIRPGIVAEHLARRRVWYPLPAMAMSATQSRVMRLVLCATGVALILAGAAKGSLLELFTGLIILGAAEVAGRLRFYRFYGRIGV